MNPVTERVTVVIFAPEVRGPKCYSSGTGAGSSVKVALSRAIVIAMKNIKGKRWTTLKIGVTREEART